MKEKVGQFWQIIAAAVLFLVSFLGMAGARGINGFADWYGIRIYPLLAGIIGRICGIFSFSVAEFGLYLLMAGIVVYGIRHRKKPVMILKNGVFLVSVLTFFYVINCGINYSRTPLSYTMDLEVRDSSEEELYQLCEFLTGRVIEASETAGDRITDTKAMSFKEAWRLGHDGVKAMEKLGRSYPALGGYYPNPKPVRISWILSVQQLSGIYSPFTVEANFNRKMTPYNIPHTVCHELSHLKGFMREDEANFAGYLACVESDSPEFQYSGYLMGWIYATNALYRENPESYFQLYSRLPPVVMEDLNANSLFWDQYEGKVAETATKVNDTYLKLHQQKDGVKSYGRVVDLMLAYYRFPL